MEFLEVDQLFFQVCPNRPPYRFGYRKIIVQKKSRKFKLCSLILKLIFGGKKIKETIKFRWHTPKRTKNASRSLNRVGWKGDFKKT
jgi:hypothetical protein